MLIRKINSGLMKHSRWLFGIFTVVIIISFVGFLTPTSSVFGIFNPNGIGTVGTVYGEDVDIDTIQDHARKLNTMLRLVNPYMTQQIPIEVVFNNYAMTKYAEKHGIIATDSDVAEAIRRMPVFQKDGKFDRETYENILSALYKREGISGADVSDALRLFILGNKVRENTFANLVTSDNEVRAFYDLNNQKFDYRKVNFKAEDFKKQVQTKGSDLKKFLEDNANRYIMPAKFNALVVEFPYAGFEAEAGKTLTPEKVKEYYESHPDEFLKAASAKDKAPEVMPFEQVKAKAEKLALSAAARNMAAQEAQKFAKDIYEQVESSDADDKVKLFNAILKQRKLSASATGIFDAEAEKAGKYDEPALMEQIFAVGGIVTVTNAVFGKDAALVAFVTDLERARPKTFGECAKELQEDFIAAEAFKLAEKAAADFSAKAMKTPAGERGKLFAGKVENGKVEEKKDVLLPFDECFGDLEKNTVRSLKAGEASAPVVMPEGVMVIYLDRIIPADGKEFAKNELVWKSKCLMDKLSKAESEMSRELMENTKINSRYLQ